MFSLFLEYFDKLLISTNCLYTIYNQSAKMGVVSVSH